MQNIRNIFLGGSLLADFVHDIYQDVLQSHQVTDAVLSCAGTASALKVVDNDIEWRTTGSGAHGGVDDVPELPDRDDDDADDDDGALFLPQASDRFIAFLVFGLLSMLATLACVSCLANVAMLTTVMSRCSCYLVLSKNKINLSRQRCQRWQRRFRSSVGCASTCLTSFWLCTNN